MTAAQTQRLYHALHRIATAYQTTAELRRTAETQYGLPYADVLEMAYDNIQQEAWQALKGIRKPQEPA